MSVCAIESGGDWADASVDYLVIPDGMNLNAELTSYQNWYGFTYCPALTEHQLKKGPRPEYRTFANWLIDERGCRDADESDIVVFRDN